MLGEAPPPCSNFTFTAISHNRAILFGGFQPESDRLSHVYMAELSKESVVSERDEEKSNFWWSVLDIL